MSRVIVAMLAVLSASTAGASTDLLQLLDENDLFTRAGVGTKSEELTVLAGKPATDAKGRTLRLLAIRTLGDRAEKSARATLEQIVRSEKGFPRDYAEWALAKIDGKPAPVRTMPADTLRAALAWFPANIDFLVAADGRAIPASYFSFDREHRMPLSSMLRNRERDDFFKFVDAVGNVRIDRFSMAVGTDDDKDDPRLYIRFTGSVDDPKPLMDLLTAEMRGSRQETPEEGVTVIVGRRPPAFVAIGSTDLLLVGRNHGGGDQMDLVNAVLAVKAGKKPGALKGVFSKDLEKLPAGAGGFAIGSLQGRLSREFGFPAPPQLATATVTVENGVLVARMRTEWDGADNAEAWLKTLQEGIESLNKDLAGDLPKSFKPEHAKTFKDALAGIRLTRKDNVVEGEAKVPVGLAAAFWNLLVAEESARRE